jgi:lipid-binding SYLF domain-containing protein
LWNRANQETSIAKDSMMPNLPSAMDFYLEKEINKAAVMVNHFKSNLDGQMIPRSLLEMAKGVVFFTIIKLGFVFTGRYGTGLVIARLPGGKWSAPSAVQISGVGWGMQVGAELTSVMLILTSESAVNAFKSKAQISVGAEFGVSVGPIGRSLATDVSAGNKGAAHALSYAQSKGLFVGVSLEASGIAARPDVNRAFYGEEVTIPKLLEGAQPPPVGAGVLYQALNELVAGGYVESRHEGEGESEEWGGGSHSVGGDYNEDRHKEGHAASGRRQDGNRYTSGSGFEEFQEEEGPEESAAAAGSKESASSDPVARVSAGASAIASSLGSSLSSAWGSVAASASAVATAAAAAASSNTAAGTSSASSEPSTSGTSTGTGTVAAAAADSSQQSGTSSSSNGDTNGSSSSSSVGSSVNALSSAITTKWTSLSSSWGTSASTSAAAPASSSSSTHLN